MLRKALAFAVGFGLLSSVSALDMSAGVTGFFNSDFGGGYMSLKNDYGSYSVPWMGAGFGAFFDASYAEVSLGFTFSNGKDVAKDKDGKKEKDFEQDPFSVTYLNLSLLGKYPIDLGSMVVFPAVGFDYAIGLSGKEDGKDMFKDQDEDEKKYSATDMSQFWIKFGGGMDYGLSEAIFLRAKLLYGIGFASKIASDEVKDYKETDNMLSHGLQVGVGVGFKF